MLTDMRCCVLGLAILVAGCSEGPAPELWLDLGRTCTQIALEVRDPAILPGWHVHAFKLEQLSASHGWALATTPEGQLRLQPWPDGPGMDLSHLGTTEQFQLLTGAVSGQIWLVLDQPGRFQFWRLDDAATGTVVSPPALVDFPEPGTWQRTIIFLDDAPYVIAVPRVASDYQAELEIAAIHPETLEVATPVPLTLWQTCSYEDTDTDTAEPEPTLDGCSTSLLNGPIAIQLLTTTEAGHFSSATVLLGLYTAHPAQAGTGALYTSLVSAVELRMAAPELLPTVHRRQLPLWTTTVPVEIRPASIASDRERIYWLTGVDTNDTEESSNFLKDFLYRADRLVTKSAVNNFANVEKSRNSQLLQIGDRVALSQISAGAWSIAPISDKVNTDNQYSLAIDVGAKVSAAGFGEFLVSSELGARRVVAGCRRNDNEPL